MSSKCVLLVLVVFIYHGDVCGKLNEDDDGILRGMLQVLNQTIANIDQKVSGVRESYAAVEATLNDYNQVLENVRGCNAGFERTLDEWKRSLSMKMHAFSKKVEGIENEVRILEADQADIQELVNSSCAKTCEKPTKMVYNYWHRWHKTSCVITPSKGSGQKWSLNFSQRALKNCQQGWIESPTKCYYVAQSDERTNWKSSVQNCLSINAHLVEIRSDEEAAFLLANMPSRIPMNYILYTGRERKSDNVWKFLSDNVPVDLTVRSWDTGEPHGGAQTCGCIRQNDQFKMLDCICTGYNLYYICEILR